MAKAKCDHEWGKGKEKEIKTPDQCGNCIFCKDSGPVQYDIKIIACRRYPPQQGDRQDRPGLFPFPMVAETCWCGEYNPERKTDGKETK